MSTTTPERVVRDVLTRDDAIARAARISDVSYALEFDLSAGLDSYGGRARIQASVADTSAPLWIDFIGRIEACTVNGERVEPEHRGTRLWLPADRLEPRTVVAVDYRNEYDHTGDGFHRFRDPEDGEEYVYSNFQPFAAHRLFPCFDQPDLKASYDLAVTAPDAWEVVSATSIVSSEQGANGRTRHTFGRSAPFSTYLFALVAGPWHAIREQHDGIPLGLFGRRSMARLLDQDAAELFELTRQGFDFVRSVFDQRYPFTKYDQLFMPEFNAGAMENVGAVTFHDSFLFRDPPTESQRLERAEVLLHELVHMWFGNLVTMRWWDDLWLNESFATYISFLALDRVTRFTRAWQVFNGSMKPQAYRQDQLVTTHPVAGEVPDTDSALLNFDSITYEKGAAVLKQLVATIGEAAFTEGMRAYFRRFAWGNATLADFLGALGDAAGHPLEEWADLWLRRPSINTIGAHWTASGGRIDRLMLTQTAPEAHPWLRPHAMQLALVHEAGGGLEVGGVAATIDGAQAEVPAAAGRPAPLLVFPNYHDHDYAKALLDAASVSFARDRLGELRDPFLRQLLWTALWDMVRDAWLPSVAFLGMVRGLATTEPDPELVDTILDRGLACLRWYVPDARRESEASALVHAALAVLRGREGGDKGISWLRAAIGAASTPADLEPLLALADGAASIEGVAVDQEMRWDLAVKAVAFGVDDANDRVTAEVARDRSDRGERAVVRAGAARPSREAKADAWRRIHEEGYGSYQLTRAAMQGFLWHRQRELLRPYREPFFDRVRGVFRAHDHPFARAYLATLFPANWGEPEVLDCARDLLGQLGPEETTLNRQLREWCDDLERVIRVRAFAAASPESGQELVDG
jgi:aminopeptidase N